MSAPRTAAAVLLVASAAFALAGCDLEKYRGAKGLPPAPVNLAYPAVGVTPPQTQGRLRTPAEQKQLEADLLARKRQSRASR